MHATKRHRFRNAASYRGSKCGDHRGICNFVYTKLHRGDCVVVSVCGDDRTHRHIFDSMLFWHTMEYHTHASCCTSEASSLRTSTDGLSLDGSDLGHWPRSIAQLVFPAPPGKGKGPEVKCGKLSCCDPLSLSVAVVVEGQVFRGICEIVLF